MTNEAAAKKGSMSIVSARKHLVEEIVAATSARKRLVEEIAAATSARKHLVEEIAAATQLRINTLDFCTDKRKKLAVLEDEKLHVIGSRMHGYQEALSQ